VLGLGQRVHLGIIGADEYTVNVMTALGEFNRPFEQGVLANPAQVLAPNALGASPDWNDGSDELAAEHAE
jgi:hypothetical protein